MDKRTRELQQMYICKKKEIYTSSSHFEIYWPEKTDPFKPIWFWWFKLFAKALSVKSTLELCFFPPEHLKYEIWIWCTFW